MNSSCLPGRIPNDHQWDPRRKVDPRGEDIEQYLVGIGLQDLQVRGTALRLSGRRASFYSWQPFSTGEILSEYQ